ncbi:MAG: hypothetical protein ABTQ73_11095 [Caldilineales bacterium]
MTKHKSSRTHGAPPRKQTAQRVAQRRSPWLPLGLGAVAVAALLLWLVLGRDQQPATPTPVNATATAPASVSPWPVGPADGCRAGPRFQTALGTSAQAALATNLTNIKGLAIFDPAANSGQGSLYQHPSWDDAGYLGPFFSDRDGNIFTAPVPLVSLVDNPPDQQNRVYRVDTDTQAMSLFAELPAAQPASGNPFGVVGLAYDCDTNSLYASSIAGSTAAQEVGRIFHLDAATGQLLDQLDNVDAMGIGVFNSTEGKRLYIAHIRTQQISSIALDALGRFTGEPRLEFSYAGHIAGGRAVVRRIRFTNAQQIVMNMMDFNYSLQVASEQIEDLLTYQYDPASNAWTFTSLQAK